MAEQTSAREDLIRLLADWGHDGEDLDHPERTFLKYADGMENVVVSCTPSLNHQQLKALKVFPPLRGLKDEAVRAALAGGEVVLAANFSLYASLSADLLRQEGLEVAMRPISEEEKAAVLRQYGAAE